MGEDGSGKKQRPKKRDVLFVHGRTAKGDGYRVIRAREDRVEVGEMSDVKEGEPVRGELVKLKQRGEHPQLFDVETVVAREGEGERGRAGPAQVANDAYRRNFEAIFGSEGPPRAGRKKRQYLN